MRNLLDSISIILMKFQLLILHFKNFNLFGETYHVSKPEN